jgi:hypothetical protein
MVTSRNHFEENVIKEEVKGLATTRVDLNYKKKFEKFLIKIFKDIL